MFEVLKQSLSQLIDVGRSKVPLAQPTLRSLFYIAESFPILRIGRLASQTDLPPPAAADIKLLLKETFSIHQRDLKNVHEGYYPMTALDEESPQEHIQRLIDIFKDGFKVAWRMRSKNHRDFSKETLSSYSHLPDYYLRNFHFQSDGYLSRESAERYEHQVEILFAGTAGAMRREMIPHLKRRLNGKEPQRILDLAAGPGTSTRPLALAFPYSDILAIDLSQPYIDYAKERFSNLELVTWQQANAESLPIENDSLDVICSTYLFHELPKEVRKNVLQEAYRVLKPGGLLAIADSLQWNDDVRLNWALERFPQIYHEPFFKNYILNPLEDMMQDQGFTHLQTETSLFTKYVIAEK